MGQDPGQDPSLAPVVVTAARIAQPQQDALPHTTVITAEDIRNSHAPDLLTLLRQQAGISITQTGGPGTQASLFLRGASPAQSLILLDGVPLRKQDFSSAAPIENILPDQIERIEIVRGNVSAIYGSDAIGGVIQIFTRQGSGAPTVGLTVEAGSRHTAKATVNASGQSGATRYAVSASRFTTAGFSANNTNQYPNENPDADGYRNNSFSGSVSHMLNRDHEIGARLYANDGRADSDGGGFGNPTDIAYSRSRQQTAAVYAKDRLAQNWGSTVTLSRTRTRSDFTSIDGSGAGGDSVSRFDGESTLLQWVNEVMLSPAWKATAGIDLGREKADTKSTLASPGSFSRSTSSAYAGINGTIGAHQLQANLRHDRVGGSGSETTGFLGYGYMLTPAWKLIADASTAFHAPTLVQLFDPQYGNPSLNAERARSYEAGVQYAAAGSIVRATLFDTQIRDQFGFDAAFQTVNIDRTRNRGLEVSANTTLAAIDWRASLTWQQVASEGTTPTPIRRPKLLASLAASKAFGAWRIGGDVEYSGKRSDTDFAAFAPVTLGSYVLANANVRYELNRNTSLFGRIDNVFNRDYQTVYGYNQPPRGMFAGVSWRY